MTYHVVCNGTKLGPLNEAEVREKIARGELRPHDLCWTEGWPEWRKVGAVFPATNPEEPPPLPPSAGAAAAFTGTPKRCGLAVVSLVCGICTIVLFPLFFLFVIPAVVCGHMAQARIKQAKGALLGGGMAVAGLVMGYLGIAMVPVGGLMAAMAIPAFQKVRVTSMAKTMNNDARLLAAAAQQHFLENNVQSVALSYDAATGEVRGPLATYVHQIAKGYTVVPEQLTSEGTFELGRTSPRLLQRYDCYGAPVNGTQLEED
ncbi:MAG: DUF4190 domain-containing protein [Opitutaceae bacterium]